MSGALYATNNTLAVLAGAYRCHKEQPNSHDPASFEVLFDPESLYGPYFPLHQVLLCLELNNDIHIFLWLDYNYECHMEPSDPA